MGMPVTQQTIDFLSDESEAKLVIERLKGMLADDAEHRRYFAVGFVDGSVRAVYPDQADPLRFDHQVIGNIEGILRLDPRGHVDDLLRRRVITDLDDSNRT
jgi:hypothetical protein